MIALNVTNYDWKGSRRLNAWVCIVAVGLQIWKHVPIVIFGFAQESEFWIRLAGGMRMSVIESAPISSVGLA
jgi:hypothetical protein